MPSSETLEFPSVINNKSSLVTISTFIFTSCRNLGTTFFHKALIDRKIKNNNVNKVFNK